MKNIKEKISLFVLTAVYILFNVKYAAGQLSDSVVETLLQILTTAPVAVGLTILVVSFLQRMHGERLPYDRVFRIFLTFGIIVGFFLALNEFWVRGAEAII